MLGNIGYTGELPKVKTKTAILQREDLISVIIPDNIHLHFILEAVQMTVVVKNGKVSGTLDKRAIGAEDGRLLDAIVQTNGPTEGAQFLTNLHAFLLLHVHL
jgi:hypothetical protein